MPEISEVLVATLGVANLAASARFYREAFGYEVRADGRVPEEIRPLWRMPPDMSARYVVMASPGTTRGLLRLIEADRPGRHVWGQYERIQDHGHYALNFRVPDIEAAWPVLLEAGARPKSSPLRWTIEDGMVATDSQCWDIDGTLLDVYAMEGRPDMFPSLSTRSSAIETVALHVANADRSRDFYMGLGYDLFFDRRIENLGAFFHLPEGVVLRDVNLVKAASSPIGRIEIVELEGLPGLPVHDRATPPNLGILSITFETDDLVAAEDLVSRLGGVPLARSAGIVDVGLGAVRALTAFGPDGELLEFIERAREPALA